VEKLVDKIKELAQIASALPEAFQQTCFELLLKHHLASDSSGRSIPPPPNPNPTPNPPPPPEDANSTPDAMIQPPSTGTQADIANHDLHVKTRKFMEKYAVTLTELNNLFYKTGTEVLPLFDDLKTTRVSEAQIRVALLQTLRNALASGEFRTVVEEVRTECRDRKSYDQGNFAANFKNNQSPFDFDSYTKDTVELRLSESGKKELSQLVKEMQSWQKQQSVYLSVSTTRDMRSLWSDSRFTSHWRM
jgi:hypothetical protein